ncbi:hypothetical protein [Nonomuraea salmonea]|uniref:hypothetical protein n=1 Tax=Nonomuraea salmonea TaxID=46181 RepID=UPI0031EFFA69
MAGDRALDRPAGARSQRRERLAALLLEARTGNRGALDAIVAELTPVLWHTARNQGLSPPGRRGRDPDDLAHPAAPPRRHLRAGRAHRMAGHHHPARGVAGQRRRPQGRPARRRRLRGPARQRAHPPTSCSWTTNGGAPSGTPSRACPRGAPSCSGSSPSCRAPHYDAVAAALNMPMGSIGPTRGRCFAKLRLLLAKDPDWSP